MMHRWLAAVVLCAQSLALFGCGDWLNDTPPRHLVLIVVDTLRADRMSIYGHARETTPFLDVLSSELEVYEHVHAVAPWTVPTHASLFTGLTPAEHRAQWGHPVYVDERPTLAEWLKARGFETLGISSNPFISKQHGFARGFDRYVNLGGKKETRTPRLVEGLRGWLDERAGEEASAGAKRLFLFLNLMDVHIPYQTGAYAERFGTAGSGPIDTSRIKWQVNAGRIPLSDELRREHAAAYDAAVRHTDDVLAVLFGMLGRAGLLEDALVVITSDHGEGLGEHAEIGHSISVWEEQLWVPLLVARPGGAGRRIERHVSQLWLAPSLFDWLGVERPPHLQGAVSLEDGAGAITSDYRDYFSEQRRELNRNMREKYPDLARATQHMHVAYCGDHKLIVAADGTRQHFDLRADPTERQPLAATLSSSLECEAHYASLVAEGRFTPFEDGLTDEQRMRALEVHDEEVLRRLGYIE